MLANLKLNRIEVKLDELLLDPNNPRFFDLTDWQKAPDNLFHIESYQNAAMGRLEGTQIGQIEDLRESIRSNGYIPAELMIVKEYQYEEGKYVVIEGNRRLVALKTIVRDTMDPDDELVESIRTIEVLVYEPTGDDKQDQINEMILQGVRHIGGPKEWGAYQKANLIVRLYDELEQSWTDIGHRLGLSAKLTARYYRAYKALRQMMNDDEYGDYSNPSLFSLFDEAIKRPSLKMWLGWDEEKSEFTKFQRLNTFYSLLVGDVDSEQQKPRITNPQHMRGFAEVLQSEKQTVLMKFLDKELDIDEAVQLAKPDAITIPLSASLRSFKSALAEYPAERLREISDDEIEMFDEIINRLNMLKKMRDAVRDIDS